MAPTKKQNDGLLARVNFPLYSIEMLTSRHILVAGGGGSSKTGVANGFEIYEIFCNGKGFIATEIIRHETGPAVVMNCAVRPDLKRALVVAGQESHCQMYLINPKVTWPDEEEDVITTPQAEKNSVKKRKGKKNKKEKDKTPEELQEEERFQKLFQRALKLDLSFEVQTGDSIQTDFAEPEPLQRAVRISPNGEMMATGGLDGHIRVWNFPKMTKLTEIPGHSKEIDDLDFSPDSKMLVSVAKDGQAIVWDLQSGKELNKLTWTPPQGIKYMFKRCRFGTIEGRPDRSRLFTLSNPIGKSSKSRGFLQQWNIETGKLNNIVEIPESLSALTVREDGRFVAIGTMFTGSVSIYIAFSLQRVLYIPHAHSMFVTGLIFLPVTDIDGPAITSHAEAAVVSISVDNKICLHPLQPRRTLPQWLAIILIIIVLYLTFMFCSYLGI